MPSKKNKTKRPTRKAQSRRAQVNLANRPAGNHARVSLNEVAKRRLGDKTYSQNAANVYDQIQRQMTSEPIMQSTQPMLLSQDGNGLAYRGWSPSRGITATLDTRVTVTIGTQGFGYLIIRHDYTGIAAAIITSGAPVTTDDQMCDLLYTNGSFTGTSTNLAPVSPSGAGGLGVGVLGASSCSQGPYSGRSMRDQRDGAKMVACLGQTVTLAANRSSVTSRKGQITAVHLPGSLIDFDVNTFDGYPKARTYDAADLTEDSQFIVHRPPLACGVWRLFEYYTGTTSYYAYGNVPGGMFQTRKAGWTVFSCSGNSQDEYVFDIRTLVAFGGLQVAPEIPICYDLNAYAIVSCAKAHSTGSSFQTSNQHASAEGRETHKDMESTSTSFIPAYVHDGLLQVGGKLLERAMSAIL